MGWGLGGVGSHEFWDTFDPDSGEILLNAALYWGLLFLRKLKQSCGTEMHHNLEI